MTGMSPALRSSGPTWSSSRYSLALMDVWNAKKILDLIIEAPVMKPNLKAGFAIIEERKYGYWTPCYRSPRGILLSGFKCRCMGEWNSG